MKMKNLIAIFLIMLLNIVIIGNAFAAETLPNCPPRYEENPFTDEECLADDYTEWQEEAQTEYHFNAETGEFELTGSTYAAMPNNTIYYSTSGDGKELYAYIPHYNQKITSMRDTINQLGILTTASCDGTLKVTKTVVGVGDDSEDTTPSITKDPCTMTDGKYYGSSGEEVTKDEFDKQCRQPEVTPTQPQTQPQNTGYNQVISTPDTASTASVVSIALGTAAIAGGGYALMRKFDIPIKIGKGK